MFTKILIANRGEIAVRIARTCREMGIVAVAVYSDADRTALHVRACDEAYHIGPSPATESYLRGDKIIEVARVAGCDAIHPGYGFLSENAAFAKAVMEAGIAWIGPSPEAITLMGSKIESKRLAERVGVPIVPGYFGDDQSPQTLAEEAQRIGFPLLVKASAGGGGKGMRVVENPSTLTEAVEGASREALAAFGDGSLMLEKYLTEPRHIEVQVLGDNHGNLIHLGERECSIQRRHQKVVEEAPSPIMTPELRERMTGAALALAQAAGYTNAGTVEFIYQSGEFYFLEMNTRLQVEHPVTEEALGGLDLVELQIKVAAGEELPLKQEDVRFTKHAIEVRLYAEDPERGFLPSTGVVSSFSAAHRARIDAGVIGGDTISPYYDPMIAKIITSGETRQEALSKLRQDLSNLEIKGLRTNLDFLRWISAHPQFEKGEFSTRFIEQFYQPGAYIQPPIEVVLAGAVLRLFAPRSLEGRTRLRRQTRQPELWNILPWRQSRQNLTITLAIEERRYDVTMSYLPEQPNFWSTKVIHMDRVLFEDVVEFSLPMHHDYDHFFNPATRRVHLRAESSAVLRSIAFSPTIPFSHRADTDWFYITWGDRDYWIKTAPPLSTETLQTAVHVGDEDTLESPMPGKVLKVLAEAGDTVADEQPLVIIEAMKMEFTVRAPHAGKVAAVHYKVGDQVAVGDVLVEMEKPKG